MSSFKLTKKNNPDADRLRETLDQYKDCIIKADATFKEIVNTEHPRTIEEIQSLSEQMLKDIEVLFNKK